MKGWSVLVNKPSREQFFKLCRDRGNKSLACNLIKRLKEYLGASSKPPLIWLGTNTCAGDMLSLVNSIDPGYRDLINELIDFRYNYLFMTAEGDLATDMLYKTASERPGEFILVVEGTIPTKSKGFYAVIGRKNGKPLTALQAVRDLAPKAKYVVAAGTCAAFGGPYAAAPNPSGSKPVQAVVHRKVINVPGCPIHPDWMMGTLAHLVWYGEPEMDGLNRPIMFYGETIHNLCQRRHFFEQGKFAKQPGEPWCMYKIGCKGPSTYADCPYRQWSGEHLSWPVKANTPCIGCTSPEFPDGDAPFFKHMSDVYLPGIRVAADRVGMVAGMAAALGIGAHLAGNIITGRLGRTIKKGFGAGDKSKVIQGFKRYLGKPGSEMVEKNNGNPPGQGTFTHNRRGDGGK
ncbi:MAG: hydrogenase small subunit [Bacillota bacterium]